MKGLRLLYALLFCASSLYAQDFSVSGTVIDMDTEQLSFVNVLVFEEESEEPLKGTTTDEDGSFLIENLEAKTYKLTFSFVGYKTIEKEISISSDKNIGTITLKESTETLDETIITAKKPTIEKTAGKLVFNVENTSFSTGSTLNLLKKTPGVLVIGESIQIKFDTPVIYINDKRVYLSASEVISLLQNTDAASIKSVEVITNPSAKYDAEASSVLNIITSKAISIGYKGSVNGTYEQAIYPKYNIGTSHFYKNDWINFYGSYSFSPRKEFKEDDNFIRFFEPNGNTNSIWNTDFTRTTHSYAHQGNVVADFALNDKQTISITSSILVSPNQQYDNTGFAEILNAQQQLDSTFTTLSNVKTDKHNLSFNADYNILLAEDGSNITVSSNYVNYENQRLQGVRTDYYDPNGDFLRNNTFETLAHQNTDIFTGQADLSNSLWSGTLEAGVKYSNIDTESKLDFFDIENNTPQVNQEFSDDFNYKEKIIAEYINFSKTFENFDINLGLRGEYTFIESNSRSLGEMNDQKYFELFPKTSIQYTIDENNNLGLSYARSIGRPRYESLNPFRYFINENNFNSGNPNLVPQIGNKITANYNLKNKLFFELYYEHYDNALKELAFQDNINRTLRNSEANLIDEFQYSFDVSYINPSLTNWWYMYLTTSSYYFENEFFSVESIPETYSNDTYGFFARVFSRFTLSKDGTLTSDFDSTYLSNIIHGSYDFKNQFKVSISFRKSFWDNRASITVGVDDIFDTYNIPLTSKYYNQDNSFFSNPESRLFRIGFKYNFGNARLRDNNRSTTTEEAERIN